MQEITVAARLALTDIRLVYRRSTLGPLWVTGTLFAQISVIGLLFSRLFDQSTFGYLLHLGSGLIAWTFVVSTLNESAMSLITSGPLIKQVLLPPTVHVYRVVFKNAFLLAHNLLALVPFYFLSPGTLSLWSLLVVPGLVLAVINLGWVAVVIATVSARYRDLPAVISGVLVIVFYVTPILWTEDQLGTSWVRNVIPYNPFYHLVEVFRGPLLGQPVPVFSAVILLLSAVVGTLIVRRLLTWKGHLIPFWV